jgi:hypothetical protein
MKKQKVLTKIMTTAALSAVGVLSGLAQPNLGSACGCPAVASRPTVLMSTLPGFNATTGELDNGALLTCDKTYILDQKIYVPSGKTISIAPGTVIKGRKASPANATALIIERGGKIDANGTADCQIVFTAEGDKLDNTFGANFSVDTARGQWGGIVILGKASNNLTLAANGPFTAAAADGKLAVADGIGTIEGFASSNSKDQFGNPPAQFDDNDNSGTLRYVSIRFAGAILTVGAEINALSLGSVGRGTTIDHLDIVASADDGIELWGGTVNLKYISLLFGNDDMLDWDDGYRGKVQFLFGLKAPVTYSVDSDNGIEADADDQKSNNLLRSHPVIYNATFIGNSKSTQTSDNSAIAGINAKEYTEGEIYNSIFANFKYGFNLVQAVGTRTGGFEAYGNWSNLHGNGTNSLIVKCNTFVATTNDFVIDKLPGSVATDDRTQFTTTDNNVTAATVTGFDFTFPTVAGADPTPNPALSTTGCVSPVDGFFVPAPYRGAFSATGKSWLSDWSYSAIEKYVKGIQPCPTDIDANGTTNVADLNALLQQFNKSCQ